MTFAIQHCLLYPDRAPSVDKTINFKQPFQLDFSAPDFERYPCLKLAYETMQAGGSAPAIFNAANEISVNRFLETELAFLDIPLAIEYTLDKLNRTLPDNLEALLEIDACARNIAADFKKNKH